MEKAMSLYEAADVLGVHYSTVFAKRHKIGFQLPGGRKWHVFPSTLENMTKTGNNLIRLTLQVDNEDTSCQSRKETIPPSGGSISHRQAAKELDTLLKQKTGKKRKSTTTS